MTILAFTVGATLAMASTPATAQSPLCPSEGEIQDMEWVSRISIDGNSVTIPKTGYHDTSSTAIATLAVGQSYSVEVDVWTNGAEYNEYVNLWLDLNQDGTIDPTGELLFQQNASFATFRTFYGTIIVPASAFNGQVYGRIIMQYDASPALCGDYTYGTTVDFRVGLEGGGVNPAAPLPPTDVIAVAGDGEATVSFTPPATGATPTKYEIVSEPGGISVTTTGTSVVVPGLTNGQSYVFHVYAKGTPAVVSSPASLPSNPVTPQEAAQVPDPATSTGSVAAGTAGAVTVVTVTLEDANGNAAGGAAGLLAGAVSGANTATLGFAETVTPGIYEAGYTPVTAGTDSIAVTLDGVALSNAPLSSTVSAGAASAAASTGAVAAGTAGAASVVTVDAA